MSRFHFETNAMEASSLVDIAGVYWSARDMDPSPIGNHHFITFVYESETQARRVTQSFGNWPIDYHSDTNDRGLTIFFSTMGVSKTSTGQVRINFNPSSDLQAIHEVLKDSNTSWNAVDYDYEAHRMLLDDASPAFANNEALMLAVLECIFAFYKIQQQGVTIDYSLWDENCACAVNSIFKQCGYSRSTRENFGEFTGTDWGEEDEIPDSFFNLTYEGNNHTKEIHVPHCGWVDKINSTHRVQFSTIAAAISQGYNGCAYCLSEIDTDRPTPTTSTPFTLHLLSISCVETEDNTGADSAYLRSNGSTIWGPEQINNGEIRNLSETRTITFESSIRLDLYDQDTGFFFDSDDYIGGVDIPSSQANRGIQETTISGDGAEYILRYRVELER